MRWTGSLFLAIVLGGVAYLAVRVVLALWGDFDLVQNGLDLLGLVVGAIGPTVALSVRPGKIRQSLAAAQRHLDSLRAALDGFHADPSVAAFFRQGPNAPTLHQIAFDALRECATARVNGSIVEVNMVLDLIGQNRRALSTARDELDASHHLMMLAYSEAVQPGCMPASQADMIARSTYGLLGSTSSAMGAVRTSVDTHA